MEYLFDFLIRKGIGEVEQDDVNDGHFGFLSTMGFSGAGLGCGRWAGVADTVVVLGMRREDVVYAYNTCKGTQSAITIGVASYPRDSYFADSCTHLVSLFDVRGRRHEGSQRSSRYDGKLHTYSCKDRWRCHLSGEEMDLEMRKGNVTQDAQR